MKNQDSCNDSLFSELREPKSALLVFVIFHVIILYVYERWFSGFSFHGSLDGTYYGIFILVAAFALWVSKPFSYLVAVVLSGYMFYTLGRWVSGFHGDASAFREDGSVIWSNVTSWWGQMLTNKPEYIIQVILAALILCHATFCLVRHLSRKQIS